MYNSYKEQEQDPAKIEEFAKEFLEAEHYQDVDENPMIDLIQFFIEIIL